MHLNNVLSGLTSLWLELFCLNLCLLLFIVFVTGRRIVSRIVIPTYFCYGSWERIGHQDFFCGFREIYNYHPRLLLITYVMASEESRLGTQAPFFFLGAGERFNNCLRPPSEAIHFLFFKLSIFSWMDYLGLVCKCLQFNEDSANIVWISLLSYLIFLHKWKSCLFQNMSNFF